MRWALVIRAVLSCAAIGTAAVSAQAPARWLDQPLTAWNRAAAAIPASGITADARAALEKRCGSQVRLKPDTTSASVRLKADTTAALRAAGWVPFLHLDQAIARGGIEVMGGMTAASPGCEPTPYNLFVFAGGTFAGTVSPTTMASSRDGAAGAVRILGPDAMTVEFARFIAGDSECCPSSRLRVTYRIDKTIAGPALVATDLRQVR
jgi:hypothetical protein